MHVIAIRAAFAALLVLPVHAQSDAAAPSSVLSAVPETAGGLAYCANFADLRRRADQNDWVKLCRADASMLDDLEGEMRGSMELDPDRLYAVAGSLRGESVLFLGDELAGFYTTAPEPRAEAREALRGFLPAPAADAVRSELQIGAATVEVVAWPDRWGSRRSSRAGHFAAFVDHPLALGLVSANDYETLKTALADAIGGLESGRTAPLVAGFQAARARAARTTGIEVYLDYRRFADESERMLRSTVRGDAGDPTGMLGLEENTWLHASVDFHPGRRIDGAGFLNLPQGTLAAKLADTFAPLPASLPSRLPGGLQGLWALQWDAHRFYTLLREAFQEADGEDAWAGVESGVQAAEGMTGVNPIQELLARLDGTFAFYSADVRERAGGSDEEWLGFGLMFGVKSGELFQAAFEKVIESTLDSFLELDDVEGVDVYSFAEDTFGGMTEGEWQPGGLAFTPAEFLLSLDGPTLRRHLAALRGEEGQAAAGQAAGKLLDEELGACFFGAMDLGWAQRMQGGSSLRSAAGDAAQEGADEAPKPSPLDGVWLLSTARRRPDGFSFEMELR